MRQITLLFTFFLTFIATSCDKDDDDNNNNAGNNNTNNEVVLTNLGDGEGALEAIGDTVFFWSDSTTYDYFTTLTSSGTTYDQWEITMSGSNPDEEMVIKILQVDSDPEAFERVIPEDGTYVFGGSMDENDVLVRVNSDTYFFNPSSVGSLTLNKNGEVWNIELNAEGLESGGIGEEDMIIDIEVALKAIPQ